MTRVLVLAAVLGAWLLALAGPVLATDPPKLDRRITDIAERLDGVADKVTDAIEDLEARRGIRLWVVTLRSIEGDDPALFAESIASANELGSSDAVLFISFDDRQFGLWAGEDLALSVDRIDQLLVPLGDALRAGDVGAGVAVTASNLEAAVDGADVDPGPWSGGVGEEPVETIPFEPDDPGILDPGPIIDPGGFQPGPFEPGPGDVPFTEPASSPGGSTPVVLVVVLAGGVALAAMGGGWMARRRRTIADLEASAAALAGRAVNAASTGRAATDALATAFGDGAAEPFRGGIDSADLSLARVRAARSRLGAVKGLALAPRRAAVADLEGIVAPIEAWSAAVSAERTELEGLARTADDRTAALVDDLPRLRATVADARARIDGLRAASPSAHATLTPEGDGLVADLAWVEDRARVAAASLAAGQRASAVLALRAALRASASLAARGERVDQTADRVARAVAERAKAADEASSALEQAAQDLETSPMPKLTPRLAAARAALVSALRETDALVAWEAMRGATSEAGSLHAEVLAARRRAREALDGARIATASMVVATVDRADVRSSTRRIADDTERRLRALLADPPIAPEDLRATAQSIADDADAIRRRADEDVRLVREKRDGRRAIGMGAGAGFVSSSSDMGSSSSIGGSSSGSSGSAGGGGGGGTSSGGSW
jgi:uncharacterized membrane protein YgcG